MPRNEVLGIVSATPEIEWVVDATWMGNVVDWAMAFAVSYCNLPCYPELLHGCTNGRTGAEVDLTDLTSGAFLVSAVGAKISRTGCRPLWTASSRQRACR